MDSARVSKYLNPTRKEKSWWMEQDDEDEEDIGRGINEICLIIDLYFHNSLLIVYLIFEYGLLSQEKII